MGLLGRLLLGTGAFAPDMRAALETEGVVLLEEGLGGRLTYRHFRAPGKRFHGKVVPVRLGLAITERRLVAYAGSGRHELMDSAWDAPNLRALDVALDGDGTAAFRVDYDRLDEPRVSGEVTIRVHAPDAPRIVAEVRARLARAGAAPG